jgi:hypothetical protein
MADNYTSSRSPSCHLATSCRPPKKIVNEDEAIETGKKAASKGPLDATQSSRRKNRSVT